MLLPAALMLAGAPAGSSCRSPRSQSEMNRCAAVDFESADAAMNLAWRPALAFVRDQDKEADFQPDGKPSGESRLRDAQRAWLIFRDAHCTVESYGARGGTMEPMLYESCRARVTRERTRQLHGLGSGG
jgi:uncharacterized protein YecT (DUF1311 family)